jgi:hypothetical protein
MGMTHLYERDEVMTALKQGDGGGRTCEEPTRVEKSIKLVPIIMDTNLCSAHIWRRRKETQCHYKEKIGITDWHDVT